MAKESGLGATVSVDDSSGTLRDISNDITDFSINTARAEQNVTGVDKSANERLQLLADGTFTMNGVFNDAANKSHAVLKTIPSTSVVRTVTIVISGQTLSMEMILGDYALTRSAAGDFTWSVACALASGTVPSWS